VGFRLKTLNGREGILAHVDSDSPYRVSKYGVEVKTFEDIAVPALEEALKHSQLLVLDELGRMELFSKLFQQTVHRILESPVPVLAVIQDRRNPFLDAIRLRKDVTLIHITDHNRNQVVSEIIDKFCIHFNT
jgi:nucleoside-triphosphatase